MGGDVSPFPPAALHTGTAWLPPAWAAGNPGKGSRAGPGREPGQPLRHSPSPAAVRAGSLARRPPPHPALLPHTQADSPPPVRAPSPSRLGGGGGPFSLTSGGARRQPTRDGWMNGGEQTRSGRKRRAGKAALGWIRYCAKRQQLVRRVPVRARALEGGGAPPRRGRVGGRGRAPPQRRGPASPRAPRDPGATQGRGGKDARARGGRRWSGSGGGVHVAAALWGAGVGAAGPVAPPVPRKLAPCGAGGGCGRL